MSEISSSDAVIAVHPGDDERFALQHRAGSLPASFVDRLRTGGADGLKLFGRSVLGQMGVNIVANDAPIIASTGRQVVVHTPVAIEAHSSIGDSVLADLEEMREGKRPGTALRSGRKGKTIDGGRFVDFGRLKRLEKPETEDALRQGLLAIDARHKREKQAYRVNDDGSVTVPIALIETLVSDYTLSTREERLNAIKHGRAGLKPHIDTVERRVDDILPPFLIGGIALSPGPFTCVIREQLNDKDDTKQLSGAAMVDGNRLMGIGRDLDLYTGHRQIELVNTTQDQRFGDTAVTVDIYRETGDGSTLNPIVDWYDMTTNRRHRLHQTGISPLDVIHVANPSARDRLAETYRGSAGVIMSAHGVDMVPSAKTDKLTADHVLKAAKSFGRNRPIEDKHLQPFVEALAPAGDRSRVFAGKRLLAEYMPMLADGGDVQSFLVEDFGDLPMSQQVHAAMTNLVRSGVSIGWDNQGEMRTFHRSGLWVRPEDVSRIEQLDLVIAMYGTHRKAVDRELKPKIEPFFQQLTSLMPAQHLAITHGNGPGVMRMSDVLARQQGMMSLVVGIEVEGQEEGPDILMPNGIAHFKDSERLYRQQRMDKLRILSVINPGGDGTIEETAINVCTNKLNSAIPGPTIIVDPPGDYFAPIVAQFAQASNRRTVHLFGKNVNISKTPFAQPWVTNTIHHVRDYEEAFVVIQGFWKDPAGYWDKADVPPGEVLTGGQHHGQEWGHMGMHLADRFIRAISEFTT